MVLRGHEGFDLLQLQQRRPPRRGANPPVSASRPQAAAAPPSPGAPPAHHRGRQYRVSDGAVMQASRYGDERDEAARDEYSACRNAARSRSPPIRAPAVQDEYANRMDYGRYSDSAAVGAPPSRPQAHYGEWGRQEQSSMPRPDNGHQHDGYASRKVAPHGNGERDDGSGGYARLSHMSRMVVNASTELEQTQQRPPGMSRLAAAQHRAEAYRAPRRGDAGSYRSNYSDDMDAAQDWRPEATRAYNNGRAAYQY